MSKFDELVDLNYRSCIFALAHNVDYSVMQEIESKAVDNDEFEVAEGIKKGIEKHKSSDQEFYCSVKPVLDEDFY